MEKTKWFERKFPPIKDNGLLPGILERLEGTPFRLEAKIRNLQEGQMETSMDGKWGIKKEIGHLIDLEPLWLRRFQQIIDGLADLKEADLQNTKTHEAGHDKQTLESLVLDFRDQRQTLLKLLRNLQPEDLQKAARHPRLGTPMFLIDLAFFVAEHDDHHLAQITFLSKNYNQ